MLRDSVAAAVVVRTRPRAIPLAIITMRKSTHGFPSLSYPPLSHAGQSRETKKALFYHAEPRSQNHGGEAKRGKTKLFWSPGTIWPPCDKGELGLRLAALRVAGVPLK